MLHIPTDIVSKCAWAEKISQAKVYNGRVYDRIEIRHLDTYLNVLNVMAANADFALFTFSKQGIELRWLSENMDWGQRCISDTRAIVNCTWDYQNLPAVHLAFNIAHYYKLLERLAHDSTQTNGRNVDLNLVIEFRQGHQFFKMLVEPHRQDANLDSCREPCFKKARKSRSKRAKSNSSVSSLSSGATYFVDEHIRSQSTHHEYRTFEEQDDEDQVRQRMIEEEEAEKLKEAHIAKSSGVEQQNWTRNDLTQVVCPLDFSCQDQQRQQKQHIAPFVVENYPSNELDYAFESGENAFVNPYVRFRISADAFETSANGEAGFIHFLLISKGNHAFMSQLHRQYQHTYHSLEAHSRLGSGKDMITTDFWTYTVERMERSKRYTIPLSTEVEKGEQKGGEEVGEVGEAVLCPTLEKECVFVRILRFHLVPFFTVSCWKRYGYSLDDVRKTCKPFRSCLLWLVAISNRIQLEASAVKASNAVEYIMVWGAKSNAIKTIIDKYIPRVYPEIKDVTENVLCCTIKEHKPFLPIVDLENFFKHSPHGISLLQDCLDMLPSKEDLSLAELSIPRVFVWKDIQFVPRRKESSNKFLCCVRVLPESVFIKEIHGEPTCIALKPQAVVLSSGDRYCLTEEAFLVPLPKQEKAKRKRDVEDSDAQQSSRKKARTKKD